MKFPASGTKINESASSIEYSFFVAGHTYGESRGTVPTATEMGLYPPFKKIFPFLLNLPTLSFGILTGDIVYDGNYTELWDAVDMDLEDLTIPTYFSVGNHDVQDENGPAYDIIQNRYGKTYSSFLKNDDLYIILDANLGRLAKESDQLALLKSSTKSLTDRNKNIFVFFHQLVWDELPFPGTGPNNKTGAHKYRKFWHSVSNLLTRTGKDIHVYAGDVGAVGTGSIFHTRYKNINFVASGMGDGTDDNIVITNIHKDKSVEFLVVRFTKEGSVSIGPLWETHNKKIKS